jgi:uncharacterized protein YuzE
MLKLFKRAPKRIVADYVTHDPTIDAIYVGLVPFLAGQAVRTETLCDDPLITVDYDADGRRVGIELIGCCKEATS